MIGVLELGKTGKAHGESISLGNSPSVFQDEIIPSQTCTEDILTSSHDNGSAEILSHSQGTLKGLKVGKFDLDNCHSMLKHLAEHHSDTLRWVLRLVKTNLLTGERPFTGPEPTCGSF